MKLSSIRERYWIRQDRERFFFAGLLMTCTIASFITTYWHYNDMTELKPKIKIDTNLSKERQYKILKEADYIPPVTKNTTSFYKIEEYAKPSIPSIPDVGTQ